MEKKFGTLVSRSPPAHLVLQRRDLVPVLHHEIEVIGQLTNGLGKLLDGEVRVAGHLLEQGLGRFAQAVHVHYRGLEGALLGMPADLFQVEEYPEKILPELRPQLPHRQVLHQLPRDLVSLALVKEDLANGFLDSLLLRPAQRLDVLLHAFDALADEVDVLVEALYCFLSFLHLEQRVKSLGSHCRTPYVP
jgi:hypothetical protein